MVQTTKVGKSQSLPQAAPWTQSSAAQANASGPSWSCSACELANRPIICSSKLLIRPRRLPRRQATQRKAANPARMDWRGCLVGSAALGSVNRKFQRQSSASPFYYLNRMAGNDRGGDWHRPAESPTVRGPTALSPDAALLRTVRNSGDTSMRTMRFLCRLALPAALLLGGLSVATAQSRFQGSAEARQACTPDAMRLCSEFIPDAERVKACMLRKRGQLSQACRVAMRGGVPRRGVARHGVARRGEPRHRHHVRRVHPRHHHRG